MRKILFLAGVCFIVSNIIAQAPSSEWHYHFPLDIEPKVSGSFGEIRGNHFHSGLDLTTKRRNGFPVFAADSGFVSRVAVSPVGFGKALYIDHPSGYTTVYAHLQEFSPSIDSIVTAMQYQNESFSLQHYFDAGDIPVSRGELIAFSGNSGSSGGPHLHFEVRETRGQRPIDPLAFSTPVKDDIRPQIAGIKIYPLSPDALVNGKPEAAYFPAVFFDGAFHLKHNPRIIATGVIGIGIEVIDYYSGSWRKCGVHSIDLKKNGKPLYNYTMDGFFFRDTRYLNSHIDYAFKTETRKTIQKSFVDPYNQLDVYKVDNGRGKIIMNEAPEHKLSYTVKDISGNISNLNFNISRGQLNQVKENVFPGNTDLIDASKPFFYEEANHSVNFPEGSFYLDVAGNFKVSESDISLSGTIFEVLDNSIPVHKRFEVKLPIPPSISKDGLCGATASKNGTLNYAGGNIEGRYFVIKTREAGKYALTRDTLPPEIDIKNPPSRMNYGGRKALVLKIEDDFSGIDRYKATVNGKWTLFEHDAKNDEIICFFDKVPFLEKGEHNLVVEVTDNAGNMNTFETNFRY